MSWDERDIFRAMSPAEWQLWIALFGVGSVPAEFRRRFAFEAAIDGIITTADLEQGGGNVDRRDQPDAVAGGDRGPRRYHRRGGLLVCDELPGKRMTPKEAADAAGVTWTTIRLAVAVGRPAGGLTFAWVDDVKERQGAA